MYDKGPEPCEGVGGGVEGKERFRITNESDISLKYSRRF